MLGSTHGLRAPAWARMQELKPCSNLLLQAGGRSRGHVSVVTPQRPPRCVQPAAASSGAVNSRCGPAMSEIRFRTSFAEPRHNEFPHHLWHSTLCLNYKVVGRTGFPFLFFLTPLQFNYRAVFLCYTADWRVYAYCHAFCLALLSSSLV